MAEFKNSEIPANLFAEVRIGTNGIRIRQKNDPIPMGNDGLFKSVPDTTIYLSNDDLKDIFRRIVSLSGTYNDDDDEENEDTIIDANY